MVAASDVVFDLIGDLLESDLPNANLFYVIGGVVREFTSEFFTNVTARGEEVQSGLANADFYSDAMNVEMDTIRESFTSCLSLF